MNDDDLSEEDGLVVPLFDGLPSSQLLPARMRFQVVEAEDGSTLIVEGDEDPSLLCIVSGQLEIRHKGLVLGRLGPGEIVGEIALFGDGVRTASVVAKGEGRYLLLDRAGYLALRDVLNQVAERVELEALRALVDRLREMGRRISEAAQGTPLHRLTPDPGFFTRMARLFGAGGGRSSARGVDVAAVLASCHIFQDLPQNAIAELAGMLTATSVSSGHFLCTQGHYGDEMFVIAQGRVDVFVAVDEENAEPLAVLGTGDAIGMVALIEGGTRMASCVANGEVLAVVVDRRLWDKLREADTFAAMALRTAMIRALSEQLTFASSQLARLDLEKKERETAKWIQHAAGGLEAHGAHTRG